MAIEPVSIHEMADESGGSNARDESLTDSFRVGAPLQLLLSVVTVPGITVF